MKTPFSPRTRPLLKKLLPRPGFPVWEVRSLSSNETVYYVGLSKNADGVTSWSCTCPSFPRNDPCKHIEIQRKKLLDDIIYESSQEGEK